MATATQLMIIALIFIANNCVCFLSLRKVIVMGEEDEARYLRFDLKSVEAQQIKSSNDVNQKYSDGLV